MMKLVKFALKLLPIITLYKGVTSGHAKLGPMLDIVGVSITQFEVKKITKLTMEDAQRNGGLVHPQTFRDFIRDNFYNNYTSLVRRAIGKDGWDLSVDLWGSAYMMQPNSDATVIYIRSAGPDKKYNSKDDISINFQYSAPKKPQRTVSSRKERLEDS
jgi:hypothetical protein